MTTHTNSYVPALGVDWLTRFYDPLVRITMRERTLKQRLIAQARIAAGQRVLDVGCGTGTLCIMIKQTCAGAEVVGLDGDPQILGIARKKIAAAGVDVELREGMAYDPPFPPDSFDRILTTLVFHHLTTEEKRRALAGMHSLLRPGGELHIADWGKPHNALMWVTSLGFRFSHGSDRTAANIKGFLPQLVAGAGFGDAAETERHMTVFGTLAFIRAQKRA